jgi:hypothetical protein
VFNVCSCCIIGPFKMSRLITNPNPGTSSLPFGTDTCGVVGVVPLDVVAEGWVALVALGVADVAGLGDDDVVADDDGVWTCGMIAGICITVIS